MMCSGCGYKPLEGIDHAKAARCYQCYADSHGEGIFQFVCYCKGGAEPKSCSGRQDEVIPHKIFGNLSYVSF